MDHYLETHNIKKDLYPSKCARFFYWRANSNSNSIPPLSLLLPGNVATFVAGNRTEFQKAKIVVQTEGHPSINKRTPNALIISQHFNAFN